jgi:hypothetical protein
MTILIRELEMVMLVETWRNNGNGEGVVQNLRHTGYTDTTNSLPYAPVFTPEPLIIVKAIHYFVLRITIYSLDVDGYIATMELVGFNFSSEGFFYRCRLELGNDVRLRA